MVLRQFTLRENQASSIKNLEVPTVYLHGTVHYRVKIAQVLEAI